MCTAAPSPFEGDGRAQPPFGKAAHRYGSLWESAASLWDSGGWGEGGTLNSQEEKIVERYLPV